jgi:hypothetical protein
MPQHRLDPEHPRSVVLSTKLGRSDADRVVKLAGPGYGALSAFVRQAVLRELERADSEPPDERAA